MTPSSFAYFLLLALACFKTGLAKNNCNSDLKQLGDTQGKFVNCMIHHAMPVTACISCYLEYRDMVEKYGNLSADCSQLYFNKNRFNIVYNMQKTVVKIWEEGFCDDCFENGNPSSFISDFDGLNTNFTNCLAKAKIENKCRDCRLQYGDLNYFYKRMEKEKKGKICFDIQDAMNQTRLTWSKDLKCCARDYNMTAFVIGCSLFGAVPLIFYFGMYAYTKRSERNHEIFDSTFDSGNEAAVASTSSGATTGIPTNLQNQTITKRTTIPTKDVSNEETASIIAAGNDLSTNTNNLINL